MFAWLAAISLLLGYIQQEHSGPWTGFYSDFFVAVSLVSLVFHLALTSRRVRLSPPVFSLFFLTLIIIAAGQTLTGYLPVSGDGWMSVLYCAGALLAYWVGVLFRRQSNRSFLFYFSIVVLLSAFVSSLIGLLQWLGLFGPNLWMVDAWQGLRALGNLAQPNHLNDLLMMGIACAIYLYESRRIGGVGATALALFLIIGIVLAQSRTAWGQVAFIVVWWVMKRQPVGLRATALPYVAMSSLFVLLAVSLADFTNAMNFYSNYGTRELTGSDPIRMTLWRAAVHAIGQQPFWGYGWNQVTVAITDVMHIFPGSPWAKGAHNLILDLMLWNGLVPGLLLAVSLAWWGGSRTMRCQQLDVWYALLVIGLIMIHAMVEKPLHMAFFLFPVVLLMGWVDGGRQEAQAVEIAVAPDNDLSERVVAAGGRTKALLALIGLLASLLLMWLWRDYHLIKADYMLLRFEQVQMINVSPDPRAEEVVLTSLMAATIKNARTDVREGLTDKELERMRYLTYRNPVSSELARYAYALAINGRPEEAKIVIGKLKNLISAKNSERGLRYLQAVGVSEPRVAVLLEELDVTPNHSE